MVRLVKLTPDERVVVVSPINRYRVAGPGWVFLAPRHEAITKLYIGPTFEAFQFKNVRTTEGVGLEVSVRIITRLAPDIFSPELLPRLARLNSGGFRNAVQGQVEHLLRTLLAQQSWRDVSREAVQQRLERNLGQALGDRLQRLGLTILTVGLVRVDLPANLQQTLTQAERDAIEAKGRATVLKQYLEIFGPNLAKAMPYIIQWELMNTIHKQDDPNIFLTGEGLLSTQPLISMNGSTKPPNIQMQLPM